VPKSYGNVELDPRRLAVTNMMLHRIITLASGKGDEGTITCHDRQQPHDAAQSNWLPTSSAETTDLIGQPWLLARNVT
jgi:hypothetical protein